MCFGERLHVKRFLWLHLEHHYTRNEHFLKYNEKTYDCVRLCFLITIGYQPRIFTFECPYLNFEDSCILTLLLAAAGHSANIARLKHTMFYHPQVTQC